MTAVLQEMKSRVVIQIPKAIAGVFDVLLSAIFKMTTAVAVTDPTRKTIEGGVGGGVGFSEDFALGRFEASALLTFSYISNEASGNVPPSPCRSRHITDPTEGSWAIAAALGIQGEIVVAGGFLSISLSAEMKGLLLAVKCNRPATASGVPQKTTQWGVFQATLAVELHILFVIDIGAEVQFQTQTKLNDGPCDWQEFGQIT